MNQPTSLWQLSIEISDVHVPAFETALDPFVETLMWTVDEDVHGYQRMAGFVTARPDEDAIQAVLASLAKTLDIDVPHLDCTALAPRNWVEENLKDFPPIDEGRFFIYASHVQNRPLLGRIPVRIDPGAAFGTGTHATTSGCLDALDRLGRAITFRRPLDVGCGSGILTIAMAKMWKRQILGTDIDPVAVDVARRNARLNNVAGLVDFQTGPGFSVLPRRAKFDLIVANILARPLKSMVLDMARHVMDKGFVVLSGLIVRDERFVVGAYVAQGFKLKSRHVRDGWLILVLQKR